MGPTGPWLTELRRVAPATASDLRPTLGSTPQQKAGHTSHTGEPAEKSVSSHEAEHPEAVQPISGPELTEHGYTSQIPWVDAKADCIAVTCSDHRFEDQTRDFLIHALGFKHPHVLQWPSGVTIASPLAVLTGSLSKAFDLLFQKAVHVTGTTDLILIAHEDCGAYKYGGNKLIDLAARRLTGKPVREIQIMHLQEAVRGLRPTLRGVSVKGFYADVIQGNEGEHVNFKEVPVLA